MSHISLFLQNREKTAYHLMSKIFRDRHRKNGAVQEKTGQVVNLINTRHSLKTVLQNTCTVIIPHLQLHNANNAKQNTVLIHQTSV
jgi:hypothetical protein